MSMLDQVSITVSFRYGAFLRDSDGNRVDAVCHLAT
jgi:hypothetical protein